MTLVQPNYARFVRVERAKMTTLTKAIKMIVGARVALLYATDFFLILKKKNGAKVWRCRPSSGLTFVAKISSAKASSVEALSRCKVAATVKCHSSLFPPEFSVVRKVE